MQSAPSGGYHGFKQADKVGQEEDVQSLWLGVYGFQRCEDLQMNVFCMHNTVLISSTQVVQLTFLFGIKRFQSYMHLFILHH